MYRFVLIGRSEDKTIPQADNDQVTAACEMTRILLQLGGQADRAAGRQHDCTPSTQTARAGICAALRSPACRWISALFIPALNRPGRPIDALEAALEQKADCLLCGDDEIAYEVHAESCATGIFWCRTICALPACTTARCWPVVHALGVRSAVRCRAVGAHGLPHAA